VKYAGAGIVIVAGAAAGAYYGTRPPTPTETTTSATETTAPTLPYAGQRIIVQTEAGLQEEQFHYYGKKFTEMTGCEVEVSPTPVGGTYDKLMTEFVAGTGAYDVIFLIPMWSGDFMGGGYFLELDDYIKKKDAWLDDIEPTFKDSYMKWGDHYYGITSDGDVFNVYYRKDLFSDPKEQQAFKAKYGYDLSAPNTWEEFLNVAEFWNRPEQKFWGTAEDCAKGEGFWWFINRFSSYGGRWFNPDTMEPEVNSPAGVKALENQVQSVKYSPAGTLTWSCTETRGAFYQGQLAMIMDWPDPGLEVEEPDMSKITGGKAGFAMIPGSKEVWNNDEKTWVNANDLPDEIKANHVYDGVYHAASLGYGCALCIAKTCKYPDAAYDFIRYFTSPEISLEVVSDKYVLSGLDPYRKSHFASDELRKRNPWFGDFLAVEEKDIESGYPDMRIRGTEHYWDVLYIQEQKALAGQISAKAALDAVATEWKRITDELGKDEQLRQWKESFPHTPYGP
jgi:multiple sugar transport system substrate-binding protein